MIQVIQTSLELETIRSSQSTSIGFVPTMGNLHEGHLSLLEKALVENEIIYFSIFVNPKQFGPNEDFNRYPRTFEADLEKIKAVALKHPDKQVFVFHPSNPSEVFPTSESLKIEVTPLNNDLEGVIRPGHFDGVATVVYKLFRLMKPNTSYFGLKDFQQYLVIKKMVSDLQMGIKIIGMPIKRDHDGLALSSRNQYLSADERKAALILSKTLQELQKIINGHSKNIEKANAYINDVTKDTNWNYLELRDATTFSKDISHSNHITILAVYQFGKTRLLDNIQLEIE